MPRENLICWDIVSDVYSSFAAALDRLPNGYPRTESGIELLILQKLFTPEEAALASLLTGEMQPVASLAALASMRPRPRRSTTSSPI